MKRIILFAFASLLLLGSAGAATKATKKTKATSSAKTKVGTTLANAKEQEGYAKGYAVVFDDKSDPFGTKLTGQKEFLEGYEKGLKQNAIDQGKKVGRTINGKFEWSKIPNWKKSKKACEYWVEGYKSMLTIALAGYKAGFDNYEKESDDCTVPAAYSAESALYKTNYKNVHPYARKAYLSYVDAYKKGYASPTAPEPEMEGDGFPYRREQSTDWYTIMFSELEISAVQQFNSISNSFYDKINERKGFADGYADKKAGKASRF